MLDSSTYHALLLSTLARTDGSYEPMTSSRLSLPSHVLHTNARKSTSRKEDELITECIVEANIRMAIFLC